MQKPCSDDLLRSGSTLWEKWDVGLPKWKSWQSDQEKYVTLPIHHYLC